MELIIFRAESPATARRRSSGFPPTNSRQGSFVGQYARQWDSPRGSVSSPRGSISSATLPRSRLVSNIFVEVYQKIVSGGNMLTFLISRVWGLALITEEELLEYSDFAIEGEVISSECISSSVDDNGTTTTQFEATLSIISTIKGENISKS